MAATSMSPLAQSDHSRLAAIVPERFATNILSVASPLPPVHNRSYAWFGIHRRRVTGILPANGKGHRAVASFPVAFTTGASGVSSEKTTSLSPFDRVLLSNTKTEKMKPKSSYNPANGSTQKIKSQTIIHERDQPCLAETKQKRLEIFGKCSRLQLALATCVPGKNNPPKLSQPHDRESPHCKSKSTPKRMETPRQERQLRKAAMLAPPANAVI